MEVAIFFLIFYLTKSAIIQDFNQILLLHWPHYYTCTKGTRVFRFWGPLRFSISVLFRSRLSVVGKIISGLRIHYSMRFGVFLASLRKIYASTTSTARTYILTLLAVMFGFDRNLFWFAVFYYYLHGFAISYIRLSPPQ